jgi:16S rRNA (cytosine967-C5)-methyltransferase
MTPVARLGAAVALLDAILSAAKAQGASADTLIARYFATRRYAGSKDRAQIRTLVYAALRLGEAHADMPASLLLARSLRLSIPEALTAFGAAERYAPPALSVEAQALLHADLPTQHFLGLNPTPQLGRAPLDVRVNTLKASRAQAAQALQALGFAPSPTPYSPWGLRLETGSALEKTTLYQQGLFEIQDEASQLAALSCAAHPGQCVIDLCAGAGGKSLSLGAMMDNRGRLICTDSDARRLARLKPRAQRAGLHCLEIQPMAAVTTLHQHADCVLLDAPCTGSGTWRRNPEARFRLTPALLAQSVATQAALLAQGWRLLKSGGRLVYAVCSLLPQEGAAQIAAFVNDTGAQPLNPIPELGKTLGQTTPFWLLTPEQHGCDGFFIACLQKP